MGGDGREIHAKNRRVKKWTQGNAREHKVCLAEAYRGGDCKFVRPRKRGVELF